MKEKFIYLYSGYFKKHLNKIIICFIISCTITGLSFVEPTLNRYLIDKIIGQGKIDKLINIIIIYFTIFILTNLLSYLLQKFNIEISLKCVTNIKEAVIEKIQKYKVNYLEEIKDSVIITVTQDIAVITSFYNDVILSTTINIIYTILLTIYLFNSSYTLTAIVLITSLGQLYIVKHFAVKLRTNIEEMKGNSGEEIGYINSTLENMRIIKTYSYLKRNIDKYDDILSRFRKITWKNFKITYSQSLLINLVGILSNIFIIACGTYMVYQSNISLGTFVVFISLCNNLKSALSGILNITVAVQQFRVSLDRVYGLIMDKEAESKKILQSKEINLIAFTDIKYLINGLTLYNRMNFVLEKGRPYIIVGDNATGKSTLIDILFKEVDIDEGKIMINEDNVSEIDVNNIYDRISVSYQKNYFIKDTIEENLKMGYKGISEEEFQHILSITECNTIINNLDMGLKTILSDSNNKLSGGEMQRLNIAVFCKYFLQKVAS